MRKILILGGSGFIGKAIINEISKYNEFEIYATYFENPLLLNEHRRFKLNIEAWDTINSLLFTIKPDIIISCLRGDFDKQLHLHIKVAEHLKENGGNLYFFSTANVFDNDLSKPHYEDDLPNTHTDYGQFKIECEKRIAEILLDNACILRLPQVWGKDSPRLKELLNIFYNKKDIVVYPKLFINTNIDVMIAKQLFHIINNNLQGIFHLASDDIVNYRDFYNELIMGLGFSKARIEENFEEEGCFALLSKRNSEFSDNLRVTNRLVINYLTDL